MEIDCFNPGYEDSYDYIELEDTCHISARDEDLVFLQLNCRGLLSKQQTLSRFLYDIIGERKVDAVALAEMWLTKESLKRVNLPGYKFVGVHRYSKKGGGVGLLICEEINYNLKPDLELMQPHIEAISVKLKLPNKNIMVSSMYRPPNTDDKLFLDEYKEYIKKLKSCGKYHIVGLDHNLNLLNYEHHSSTRKFLELLIDEDQLPCITRLTRLTYHSATLIDNILVSKELYPVQHSGIVISNISDHLPCLTVFTNAKSRTKGKSTIKIRNLGEKKIAKIVDHLSSFDLSSQLNVLNLNDTFEKLHSTITKCIDEISPEKEIPVSTNHSHCEPWMSKGLRNCSKKQLILYKCSLVTKLPIDCEKYKRYRTTFKRVKRIVKRDFYFNKCVEFKSNTKKLWQMINNVTGKVTNKKSVIDKIRIDNIEYNDRKTISNHVTSYYF